MGEIGKFVPPLKSAHVHRSTCLALPWVAWSGPTAAAAGPGRGRVSQCLHSAAQRTLSRKALVDNQPFAEPWNEQQWRRCSLACWGWVEQGSNQIARDSGERRGAERVHLADQRQIQGHRSNQAASQSLGTGETHTGRPCCMRALYAPLPPRTTHLFSCFSCAGACVGVVLAGRLANSSRPSSIAACNLIEDGGYGRHLGCNRSTQHNTHAHTHTRERQRDSALTTTNHPTRSIPRVPKKKKRASRRRPRVAPCALRAAGLGWTRPRR